MPGSLLKFFSLLFFSFLYAQGLAQVFPLGLNRSDLLWNQVNNPYAQVIFPVGYDSIGSRIAHTLEAIQANEPSVLGDKKKKVSIILHPFSVFNNGFVSVAPFRSELYLIPPQQSFIGGSHWIDALAIHEYRHVQQFANARRGVTKFGAIVSGSFGWSVLTNLALPNWYFEGDAIVQETALTPTGRGRYAPFLMEYRAILDAGWSWNYEKARAGSFKHFVPDHYKLGYLLTANGHRLYGNDLWDDVMLDAVRYRGLFYPFSTSLRKRTGYRTPAFYRKTMEAYDSLGKAQLGDEPQTAHITYGNINPRVFTNYDFPQPVPGADLLVLKQGFKNVRGIYRLSESGKEKLVTQTGLNSSHNITLSVGDQKAVWAEWAFHPRWANVNYSVIKLYDLEEKRKTQITHQSYYFTPAIHPSGNFLAAAHSPPDLNYRLDELNLRGNRIKSYPNPQGYMLAMPSYSKDGTQLTAVATEAKPEGRQRIILYNVRSGAIVAQSPFWNSQLANPIVHDSLVYFSASFESSMHIYAWQIGTDRLFKAVHSFNGVFQPAIDSANQRLYYSEYTATGSRIRYLPLSEMELKPYEVAMDKQFPWANQLAKQAGGTIVETLSTEPLPVDRYRRGQGLINLHGWSVWAIHPNYGFQLAIDNKFKTLSASGGYLYNVNENNGTWQGNVQFGQFFPVLEAGFDVGGERSRLRPFVVSTSDTTAGIRINAKTWRENDMYGGIFLPINLTHHNYASQLRLGARLYRTYINQSDSISEITSADEWVTSNDVYIEFQHLQTLAHRQLLPRWGQLFQARYRNTLGNTLNQGAQLRLSADLFFPGLFPTHSLRAAWDYQQEEFASNYKFRDNFFYARGYGSIPFDRIHRVGFDYAFPIWYPDLAIGPLAFIKRFKGAFFYDAMKNYFNPVSVTALENPENLNLQGVVDFNNGLQGLYQSMGAELRMDFTLLRLLQVDLGVRFSYLMYDNPGFTPDRDYQIDFIFFGADF